MANSTQKSSLKIYFHIDELNRDAIVASALKKIFARKGHRLIFGNRVANRLLKYFHDIFDIIVLPRPHFLYDNWGDEWMSWNARIVMLSTESLGIICKDHHLMARTLLEKEYFENKKQYVDRIDAFCFWGAKQLQAIQDYAPEVADKCHVVGHPRHDKICKNNSVFDALKKPSGTKKIGIVTRTVGLNDYFGRSPLDGYTTLFDPHFQYEYYNKQTGRKLVSKRPQTNPGYTIAVQAIDAQNTLKVINKLNDEGYEVSVRFHPKEDIGVWHDILTRCGLKAEIADPKEPITKWLQDFDYILGPPSTSFYDAILSGVIPISLCSLDHNRRNLIGELWEDNNRLMEYVFKPKDLNSLIKYLNRDNSDFLSNELRAILKEEADYPDCQNSLEKFSSICERSPQQGKQKHLKMIVYTIVKYFFFRAWKLRRVLKGEQQNSAAFVIDRKTSRFIESLTS